MAWSRRTGRVKSPAMNVPAITFSVGLMAGILAAYADLRAGGILAALVGTGVVILYLLGRRQPVLARGAIAGAVLVAGGLAGAALGTRHYRSFAADHVRGIVAEDRQTAVVEGRIIDE